MKFRRLITNLWKDNVGGSLIATAIVGILGILIALIKSLIEKITVCNVIADFFELSNTLIENKIVLTCVIVIISLGLIWFVRVLMKKANPLMESFAEKTLPKIHDNSTVLFSHRISSAFPGDRGIVWYTKPKEAVKRLSILLKEPLQFEAVGDESTSQPIWWFRESSSASITGFRKLSKTKVLIDFAEFEIDKIAVNADSSYYKSYVYVECKAEKQTGLYNRTASSIAESVKEFGYCNEEYGLFNGIPVKREEYDDNAAVIKGKVVPINGAELRIRYLSKYNFIITAKQSPYNSRKFDSQSEEYFNGILNGTKKHTDFFDFLGTFQKHER